MENAQMEVRMGNGMMIGKSWMIMDIKESDPHRNVAK